VNPAFSQIDLLKKVRKKTEQKTDEQIDSELDKLFGNKKKKDKTATTEEATVQPAVMETETQASETAAATEATVEEKTGVLTWAKYDFVPGDKIIFEDDLIGEENGEFPSRWDLNKGVAEVAEVDGEKVIYLRGGGPAIVPYMKNSDQDYLPDVFTVEFDIYFGRRTGLYEHWIQLPGNIWFREPLSHRSDPKKMGTCSGGLYQRKIQGIS
jgi:hypothetical protein